MIWSAAGGHEDEVVRWLDEGTDTESEYEGGTALHAGRAARAAKADWPSAIFFAAGRGHSEVVRLLLD